MRLSLTLVHRNHIRNQLPEGTDIKHRLIQTLDNFITVILLRVHNSNDNSALLYQKLLENA